MGIKLIFLDIDGTLTQPGSNFPPQSALDAIRGAQARGNKVYLCTGRNYALLKPLLEYGFDGLIGCSGGYIEVGDKVIYDRPMTDFQKERALEILARYPIFRTVECREGSYTDDGLKEFLRENADQGSNSELLRWREEIETALDIRSMKEYAGQPIYKIIMMSMNPEVLLKAKDDFDSSFSCVLQGTNSKGLSNAELICSEYDKGSAVRKVCRELNVPIEDTYGFGDSMNDLEMIDTVGTGIVMENGSAQLKQHAYYVCPSWDQDGIIKTFRRFDLM